MVIFAIVSSVFFSDAIKDSSLYTFGWVFHIISYVVLALAMVLCFRKQFAIERVFLLIAIPLGLLYMFLLTPFSIPDEYYHYQTSYELSNRLMLKTGEWTDMGISTHFDYSHFPQHTNNSEGYERVLNEILEKAPEGYPVKIPSHRSLVYFVLQLPQAIGITIGRVFKANFIIIFYLGRLMNLMAYICCAYWAIKAVPDRKGLFFLIGIMPMSLHQAASYSYDCMTIALTLLTTALYLRAVNRKPLIQWKEYLLLIIAGTLMAPAKAGFAPLIFLVFLIPASRFSTAKKRWTMICSLLGAALAALALVWIPAMKAGKAVIDWGFECYSPSFLFHHPLSTIKIFIYTIKTYWFSWLTMAIGSKMSGLSLTLPEYLIIGYLFLLVFAALGTTKEQELYPITGTQKLTYVAVFGICMILIMGALFFTWTKPGSKEISGIQGRYFIPIIPLLLISLKNKYIAFKETKDKAFILAAVFLHVNLLNNIITFTLNR